MILLTVLTIIIVVLDQLSKFFISTKFIETTTVTLIPKVMDIVSVKNTGAAFSIFSNYVSVLGVVSLVFCIALLIFYIKTKPSHTLEKLSLTLIFAGALGNAIDRLFRGYVIDFIDVLFINFPVFNIADISITVGAALLVIYILFFDKKK